MKLIPITEKMLDKFIKSWATQIDDLNGEAADMLGLIRGERAIHLTAFRSHLNAALQELKQLKGSL